MYLSGTRSAFSFVHGILRTTVFRTGLLRMCPCVLDWAIGNGTCEQAKKSADFACRGNSACADSDTGLGGYRCNCLEGYEGNPYVSPGCTAIAVLVLMDTMAMAEKMVSVALLSTPNSQR
ncbi:Wall-associated receptor kinase [Sesamum alatum]|uniref:Wall-associated receptor kinase n=1 Tax=Sesamum alatum TaxID=300844 RepID=A0AAE1YME5_9LAMI|nr:Wall-associated receptor kinase [Sesamum alatum]